MLRKTSFSTRHVSFVLSSLVSISPFAPIIDGPNHTEARPLQDHPQVKYDNAFVLTDRHPLSMQRFCREFPFLVPLAIHDEHLSL